MPMENINKEIYEAIWKKTDVQKPEVWSIWEIIKDFQNKKCLEIGPGKYPKIPVKSGFFVDISENAIKALEKLGGTGFVTSGESLPLENNSFDLVVACDVLEHTRNDKGAFSEINRVLKPSAYFLFSVPLRKEIYGEIDVIFGHKRRYDIKELIELLAKNDFKIIKYREWSFYFKMLVMWTRFLRLSKLYKRLNKNPRLLNLPRPILNFFSKMYAFLDRFGAPSWKNNVKSLSKYKKEWIILLCQKVK